jgi:Gpi18-like mannosyltransferase
MSLTHPKPIDISATQDHWLLQTPWPLAVAVVFLGLVFAPFMYHIYDVKGCWLVWADWSGGTSPWNIYKLQPDCNYPPFALYLFTLEQRLIMLTHASQFGRLAVTLIKIPNILADAGGVVVCWYGLQKTFGIFFARWTAIAYALCLPVFFNAAIWGQYDALLSFAMIAAIVAALHDRSTLCGALLGGALSLKFQAIVIVPLIAVYLWRRAGLRCVLIATVAAAGIWAAIALPFFLKDAGHGVIASYTQAVGFFPYRTWTAFNGWRLLDAYDAYRHHSEIVRVLDTGKFLHLITYRKLGLLSYGLTVLFLLVSLWRRPEKTNLILTAGISAFAFYMLPTQIHERYLVPAAAILALLAPLSPRLRWLFIGVSASALLNQIFSKGIYYPDNMVLPVSHLIDALTRWHTQELIAVANVALFVWAIVLVCQEMWVRPQTITEKLSQNNSSTALYSSP